MGTSKESNENEKRQNMSEKLLVYDPKEADVAPNVALVAQKVLRNPLAHLITIISLPRNCIEDVGIIVTNCINVEWLNVEGNLISELPPPGAMGQCKNLKVVNLHHNGIHRVESLISLASLPRLVGLTLYNCPIYKRAGYRHHTVNTIWSLKALDHYVLSDEEIIEGAEFKNTRFESMASSLKINLNPSEKTEEALKNVLERITMIGKHHSPVIIIQRTVRGYIARSSMKGVKKVPVLSSASNGKRVVLSPRWRFQKGDVDINYQKLMLLQNNEKEKEDTNSLDLSQFADLTFNDLEHGVKGKHFHLNDIDQVDHVKKLQEEKIRESTKELNNAATMRKNDLKRQFENAEAKARVDCEKNRFRRERAKRADFSQRMKQSLDAARAVDTAYLAKERQNEFTERIRKNRTIKRDVDRTKLIVRDHSADYRANACERNTSERQRNKLVIDQHRTEHETAQLDRVNRIRLVNQTKKKTSQMSEKHAQKFAEYYLKLEKELLKYNINVTRASTLSKKRHVREAVRHDSELGAVKQVDKLNQKLRHWDEINTQFKVALELDRERVQTRHRAEKAMNVKKIKTMNMAKVATEAQNVRPHWSMPTLPIL